MPTDECNSSKPNSIIISFLHSAIAYSTHLSILEISSCEGNYWGNIAYCILLPCFKSSRKLLASNVDIIIDTEVNFGLALGRDRIAPIHWVIRCFEDVDWPHPWCFAAKYRCLWRLYLAVPDDIQLASEIAFHWCISIDMFLKDIEVPSSCIGNSDKCESL